MPQATKKLVLILAISVLVIDGGEEVGLKKVFYIYYLIQVLQEKIRTLFDSGSEVNAMSPDYTQKLGFYI